MVATVDLLIEHAAQVVTPAGTGPLAGDRQGAVEVVRDAALACAGGRVVAVGSTEAVRASVGIDAATRILDASDRVVTPGLVDAHTHLVYAGERLDEFELRAQGATYAEILAAGGGIHNTVRATRAASLADLVAGASRRLDRMLQMGTTTAEAKSGYGLDRETELRQLEAIARLDAQGRGELVATFLGAHAIEPGRTGDEVVDTLIADVLPEVARQGIARFCDIFCEKGVFTVPQSERLLSAARELGLGVKLHADELADTGGALLAGRLGAVSADHLHCASRPGLEAMARAGTVAVLLPGTAAFLGLTEHAPARAMVDLGVPVALGTDHNPGSCPAESMALMMSLAVCQMKLSPAEALVAATANSAAACGVAERVGRLAPGYQADLVLWEAQDYRAIAYRMGVNLARTVIKRGRVLIEDRSTR